MLEINRRATPHGPQYSRASKCRWEATHQAYQTHGKRKRNLGKNTWNKSPLLNSSSVGQVQHQSWFPDMQSFYSRRSCAIQTVYKNTASLEVFRPLICSSMNVSILQIIFYCYKSQITFTCKRRNSGHLCTFFKASFSVLNQSLKLLGLRMKAKKIQVIPKYHQMMQKEPTWKHKHELKAGRSLCQWLPCWLWCWGVLPWTRLLWLLDQCIVPGISNIRGCTWLGNMLRADLTKE